MSSARRAPLYVLIVAALIATGVATSLAKSSNPSSLPNGLAVSTLAESTALYCTGLTSARGGLEGHVILVNTTGSARDVTLDVVSDTAKSWTGTMRLAPHASKSIAPDSVVTGNNFGVAVQISGGGVVGEVVTTNREAQAPCISTGVTDWYAAGFDTTVGSSAELSIFNPTATPAVFNVSTFSSAGFIAPARFQGISVGPHAQVEVKLGAQIVSSTNVGVRVRVLRGSLDIVGSQVSGSRASLSQGVFSPSTTFLFPAVTTAQSSVAQLRIANPGPTPADVTIHDRLTSYTIAPLTVTVSPFGSDEVTITPNSAIPAAGYAVLAMTSSEPVVASLATGSDAGLALSSSEMAGTTFMVADFAGVGFDAANISNTSSRTVNVTFTSASIGSDTPSTTSSAQLAANATLDLRTLASIGSLHDVWVLIKTTRPVMDIAMTLPTSPKGSVVVSPLDGR